MSDAKNKSTPEENYGIRICRDGTWLHEGNPITRHNLVKLFASVLSRDAAGDYWLTTPAERGRIAVEDAPFIAVAMTAAGTGAAQALTFRTNIDDEVLLSPEHPLRAGAGEDPAPYIMVRDGLEAKIARPVYYDLVKLAVEQEGRFGVFSGGAFFAIGEGAA